MTSNAIDNLLFIQYAPGAGGRFLIVCCSTSDKVASWLPSILPDPIQFTRESFCNPIKQDHMKTETPAPYKLDWYTRQYPFTRGDNLSKAKAQQLLLQENIVADEVNANRLIPMFYAKKHFPKWFSGKVISIVNDQDSKEWLLQRRKDIFYKHENNIVHKLRYIGDHIHNSDAISKYSDHPQTEFKCTNLTDFVKQDYDEDILPGPGMNINLSNYLTWEPNKIWDTISPIVGEVNREWCTPAIQEWRKYWLHS